jgi:small subunit ribosomal protein S1
MSISQQKYDWNETNALDDAGFDLKEAEEFRNLLNGSSKSKAAQQQQQVISGTILKGIIVELLKDFVVVDVGLKSEGLVPISEFSDPSEIVINNEIEVYLDSPEDERGQIVLSREKAERQRQWEFIVQNCSEGSIVTGRVVRKVKGGLMVDIGMEAFLPGSQIDNKRIRNLDDYLGKTYEFKILKINIERKNVVVSRRELLEVERMQKKMELLEEIIEGDLRKGVVKNITDFGVFLDLDGIDGLLHITDMTWKRIRHPSEMVQLGQELEVVILNVDREKGRVALGLKQREPNPWEHIEERYPIGTVVSGKITNLLPYGAFMELESGIEGLIHVSEMSWKEVADPSEIVNKGDDVTAIVLGVQKEEGKISLGMKQLQQDPWSYIEDKYKAGTQVNCEVKSLTNVGAFVELEPGVEGVIYTADLSWVKKVAHPSEVINKGDTLDAVVLTIDRENRKISLGIKQMGNNPWDEIQQGLPEGSVVKGKITRVTAFGAFVELDIGVEGLIHVTELSDQAFGKVEDVVSKGQEISAKVVKVDMEHKRVSLSIKEYEVERKHYSQDDIILEDESKK